MTHSSLGIGVFDGLHLGHQAISSRCEALLTFSPHPDVVLRKTALVARLSTLEELRVLTPHVVTLRFSKSMSMWDPVTFLERVVNQRFNAKKVVVGYDFRFGAKKQGDCDLLQEWAQLNNIEVDVVSPFRVGQEVVRSSVIREAFQSDQFEKAVRFLGHPYLMIGTVVEGEKRGRALGFPTANLIFPAEKLIPEVGVYSAWTKIERTYYPAMVYIGRKPTFKGHQNGVEVHVLGTQGNWYGKKIKVYLIQKLRSEIKFDSAEALVTQLRIDREHAFKSTAQNPLFLRRKNV